MSHTVLDLDAPDTWHPDFGRILSAPRVWAQIRNRLDADDDRRYEFLRQLEYSLECVTDDLARDLRKDAEAVFQRTCSSVVGYHGCRPQNEESYKTRGILPSDTDSLLEQARDLFDGIPGLDDVLAGIPDYYTNHNEGKVGLLMSAEWVKANTDKCRYMLGSELIRAIANRLGGEANRRVMRRGKPTLIQCRVPAEWLGKHTTFPVSYVGGLIVAIIRKKRWPEQQFGGGEGGYLLTRGVPPENILSFIDMTRFCNEQQ